MKNLRLFAVLFCALLSFGSLSAQEVLYAPYQKFDFRSGNYYVVGKIDGRIYAYRGSSEGQYLDAYNDSMQLVATVVLDFFPAKIYDTRFIAYQNQIIALYQGLEGTKITQYAALLDGTGRLKKGPIALENARTGFLGPHKNYFSAAVSDDKKNVVIYSTKIKGHEMTVDAKWIDDQLNVTQKSHATFKAENELEHTDVTVGNDGVLYLPTYTPVGMKMYSDQLWLLSLRPGDTKFGVAEYPLNNFYAANTYMKVDNVNNRVYMGGFYSEKKNGSYGGVLYDYYDLSANSWVNHKAIAFDQKLLDETGDHNKKRAFDNFQVKQMIINNDGGFVMISENAYVTSSSAYTPGFGYYSWYYNPYMMSTIREYHYNDIMALSYNGDGVRQWDAFVYKEQYSQEDGGLFSSYALLNTGGSLGFLYNDFNSSDSRVQLATIDADGKVLMAPIGIKDKETPDWMPRSGKQVSAREIVVPCLRKRQICFAKVTF